MNVIADPAAVKPSDNGSSPSNFPKNRWYTPAGLVALWDGLTSSKIRTTPADAVASFLADMKRMCNRMYPDWQRRLKSHVEESDLPFEHKRELIEKHDLELYFFCGIVAMEAIKIRSLFPPEECDELLSEINDQIDGILERNNRTASNLLFDMLRTVKRSERDELTKPHDQIMKWIVRLVGLDALSGTKDITEDILFRQDMAEPLAFCFVHWWLGFKDVYRLVLPKAV